MWSDQYDCSFEDIFAVQDEISENMARALDQPFARFSSLAVAPAAYDLYLSAVLRSYAPHELRTLTGLLEVVTECAPHFVAAWGRLG